MRNNYRRLCEARLREFAAATGSNVYSGSWPPNEGDLMLWDESGVKRVREAVIGTSGVASAVSDVGPGCGGWRELYLVLEGMCVAERRRELRARPFVTRAVVLEGR